MPRSTANLSTVILANLRPPKLSISCCPFSSKSDLEYQGPDNQGDLSVSLVAHSSVVESVAGPDGGASDVASILQDNSENSGQLPCRSLPGPSGGSTSYRQEFCLSKAGHDLDEADLDFLSKHLVSQTASG